MASEGSDRPIRVLQVCDHLGWEGSRMHGVKRLFAWMIPRFDRSRFQVSLVSLRKRDLSEETLDALGIDITYLEKSKFDASTLPALLRVIDRKQIDVLHLHGYGATTFGRLAAARRGLPVVFHEHANLTSTPWFQKIADRMLERYTDLAIAVSQSTAEFVIGARLVRPERVRVVYPWGWTVITSCVPSGESSGAGCRTPEKTSSPTVSTVPSLPNQDRRRFCSGRSRYINVPSAVTTKPASPARVICTPSSTGAGSLPIVRVAASKGAAHSEASRDAMTCPVGAIRGAEP